MEKKSSLTGEMEAKVQQGTKDYEQLSNKPQINSITLEGNRTLDEIGAQEKGSYANSRITNLEIEEIFKDW